MRAEKLETAGLKKQIDEQKLRFGKAIKVVDAEIKRWQQLGPQAVHAISQLEEQLARASEEKDRLAKAYEQRKGKQEKMRVRLADQEAALQCVVCLDRSREYLALDCHHLFGCLECSSRMEKCPVCQDPIKKIVKVFRS